MGFEKEKRKNDQRRGFLPVWAWTLILGFIIGLIVMGVARPSGSDAVTAVNSGGNTIIYTSNASDGIVDPFEVTATYIIIRATQQAEGTQAAAPALYATATAIVEQATATQAAIDTAKP